ncbi:TPR domain-containing protein [Colletotrichum sojae]|uniref:TPR domain-containing protein n=1 Tax=Colletotrichum sojae TaxID=2175907 RepID=A0A8H6IP59_9PEZI|nr:TPR domain-containing protein [Colletotrichum sojae]
MAIQFCHRLHATSPKTSSFWVNASTKATFEESYRSIADVLALPRRQDPDVNVLVLVRDWLQREDISPWLMIVDNADDVELLFYDEANGQKDTLMPTVSYLPKTDNGKILVTSRSWDAAEKLVGKGKMIFRVPTMEEAQALQLLRKKFDHGGDEVAALRLVRTLGCIPLAVNQAAAYIYKRSQRSPLTIPSYLDELQKSAQRKGTLLRSDRGDIRRYDGVSNSVVLTWQLTFNQIKRDQPRAANLLSLMSYFHAQNIPQYMLHNYNGGFIDATEGDDDDDDDLEDDLDVLHAYSLISTTATSGLYEMHPLVQFCTKVWISEFGSPDQWKTVFLQSASQYFPSGVFETRQQCRTLMPHVQPVLDEEPSEESDRLDWSKLLTNVSWYLLMLGNYSRAEDLAQDAVRIRMERLGEEHPDTLMSMANLASTYWNQGRWKEAEELFVRVMETSSTVLGEEHPHTLTSMHNLAFTWKNQERWEDAIQLLRNCVCLRENVLGVDHPNTMSSASVLSNWELELRETSY